MFKYNDPILLVSDDEEELDEIKQYLSLGHSKVYATLDQNAAVRCFDKQKVALIMLNFRTLNLAEKFYLRLFHECERIYEIPHQVIAFVSRGELLRATDLCMREIFHSFVIVRPMLSEHFLRLSVKQALDKRASQLSLQHGQMLLRRLAQQVDRLRKDFDGLMAENAGLRDAHTAGKMRLAESINHQLGIFRDSLMGPTMKDVVKVLDEGALRKEFDYLREEEVSGRLAEFHGELDKAINKWTTNLERHLGELELVAIQVQKEQEAYSPKVLVIDDDDIQRHMLCTVLESEGLTVLQAANGNEGMGILRSSSPQLVFLDYEMPDLDGAEVLRKARRNSVLADIPIIMLTGHHEKEVVQVCLDSGANDYLVKPVNMEILHDRLEHYFPYRPSRKKK